MTCQELDARLDDWLDGTLPSAESDEVKAHLAGCPDCRRSERQLRQVLAYAEALPRSLSPARDLWPGIERQIARRPGWPGLFGWGPSLVLAAAATVLLAVTAVLWRAQAAPTVNTVEMPTPGPLLATYSGGTAAPDAALAQAEREYEAATSALLAALQRRQAALAPTDLEQIRANLGVIDRALAEVREALAKDPANPELNRMLVSTHRKKLDVLRRVVFLSTEL
jgi:anti-sigma factor RsiW